MGSKERAGRQDGLSVGAVIGIVAAVVLAVGGLVVVGMIVVFFVGLSQFGNNK